jgi:hypothetical protein
MTPRLQDLVVEQVYADEGEVAHMLLGLLDQSDDAVALEHHDAEALGLGHARQEDLGVGAVLLEPPHEARDPL